MIKLHPHQETAVSRALASPGHRFIFGDEMGVGKTQQSLEFMCRIEAKHVLIVCPAIVRGHWKARIPAFLPEHTIGLINAGRGNNSLTKKAAAARDEAHAADIQIVSYNLLDEVRTDGWDLIVFDEAHRMRHGNTGITKNARTLSLLNPKAAILELTGTLMANHPEDAYHPLDILCPGRFGYFGQFKKRYQVEVPNEYAYSGKAYVGLNPATAPELRRRIEAISTRVTRKEIAHLLPAFDVRPLYVQMHQQAPAILSDQRDINEVLYGYGMGKVAHAIEWYEGASREASHVAFLTHHKELARQLATALESTSPDRAVMCLDGLPVEKRQAALEQAAQLPAAAVIATMHSVGIGIDLTFATRALFVELVDDLEVVLQALGRFSRLSGTIPSAVQFLIAKGTIDEIIAQHTIDKINAINLAMKSGASDAAVLASLDNKSSISDWRDELLEAIAKASLVSDGYLMEADDE